MTNFEDRLWSDLVREHGSGLALAPGCSPSKPRRAHQLPIVGGTLAAAAIAAAALVLAAGSSPPAYAISQAANGAVSVTINNVIGIEAANAQLGKLGVRATIARVQAGCQTEGTPLESAPRQVYEAIMLHERVDEGSAGVQWTIQPSAIPAGDTLSLSPQPIPGHRSYTLYAGPAPVCLPAL